MQDKSVMPAHRSVMRLADKILTDLITSTRSKWKEPLILGRSSCLRDVIIGTGFPMRQCEIMIKHLEMVINELSSIPCLEASIVANDLREAQQAVRELEIKYQCVPRPIDA